MYERMLDMTAAPTKDEMVLYTGERGEMFRILTGRLETASSGDEKTVFPHDSSYGWGLEYRLKGKLMCTVFPENGAFSVMLRLSGKQFSSVYDSVSSYTRKIIDSEWPCGNGGWIHYRVLTPDNLDDIRKMLEVKFCGESESKRRGR